MLHCTLPYGAILVNSKKEKIYHVPGGQFYDRTDIKPEEGDRWFCTEDEARNAGFRASEK